MTILRYLSSSSALSKFTTITTHTRILSSIPTTRLFSTNKNNDQTQKPFSTATTPQQNNNNEETYQYEKVTFIGAGKMAEALISPLISSNIQPSSRISITDVSRTTMEKVASTYDIANTSTSMTEAIEHADLIVCAVKPQNCDVVFRDLKNSLEELGGDSSPTLLSVIAGKPIQSFLDGCGGRIEKVARSMPNTPAQIAKGVTVWTCTDNIEEEEKDRIKNILCSFGKSIYVNDESFIDMATSISGSGPAYIFMLMEAMIDSGVHMGFSRDTATTLVHHTLLGSTLYAMETNEHPAILKNSVTSPAGTTASAMYELENGKFRTVIMDAIWACYRRSLEMGGLSSVVGPRRHAVWSPPGGECMDEDKNGNGNGNGRKK